MKIVRIFLWDLDFGTYRTCERSDTHESDYG